MMMTMMMTMVMMLMMTMAMMTMMMMMTIAMMMLSRATRTCCNSPCHSFTTESMRDTRRPINPCKCLCAGGANIKSHVNSTQTSKAMQTVHAKRRKRKKGLHCSVPRPALKLGLTFAHPLAAGAAVVVESPT